MGLTLDGDWNFFDRANNIGSSIQETMGNALEVSAENIRAAVIKGIRDQKYSYAPLAQRTKEYKQKKGLSPLILIAEGDYLSSFATKKINWDEVHIGSNHPQSRALEFGYEPRGLPARPHFAPAMLDSVDEVITTLQGAFTHLFDGLKP